MRQDYFLQEGQVFKYTNSTKSDGLFSLTKWIKKMFLRFHVPFNDDCCDTTVDPTNSPVRYNQTTSHVQYYNYTNNTWTNVPAL